MPDDFVDVTDSFFTVTEERYEGVSKMFAERDQKANEAANKRLR